MGDTNFPKRHHTSWELLNTPSRLVAKLQEQQVQITSLTKMKMLKCGIGALNHLEMVLTQTLAQWMVLELWGGRVRRVKLKVCYVFCGSRVVPEWGVL